MAVSLAWTLPGAIQAQPAPGPARQPPLALVIANAAYSNLPKLSACAASGNLVASVLTRAGFTVTRQTDGSNARLGSAIATLGDDMSAQPDGRAVIYYCGYVSALSDRLFLLPVEARVERPTDVLSQGIVARLLVRSVVGPSSQAGLVLMDVAMPPGHPERPDLAPLLAPNAGTPAGLAAAILPAGDGRGPAPLASALSDMLGSGRLDLRAGLTRLGADPMLARSLLTVHPPAGPAWLLGEPAAEPEQAAPVAPIAAPQPSPFAEPNPAERRRIQLGLQRLGYFRGRITGVFGADTLAAIRQFQKDSEAEATGKLTRMQADQLLQP